MELVLKKINNQEIWDSFVEKNHTSTLMHKWSFLKTIEKYSGYKLIPYGIYNNNEIMCILPIFIKQLFLNKLIFSPPPRMALPYLGFVFNNDYFNLRADQKENFIKMIYLDLDKEIRKINPSYLQITSTPNLQDFRIFKWNNYHIDIQHTYVIDLSKPTDQIFSEMKKRKRQKINKAKREGIEIHEINEPDFVYESINKKYEKQKITSPIISKEYLKDLKKSFPNNIIFRIAQHDGKIVGSEALINYHKLHLNWIGGSTPDIKLPVNELLLWDYIVKAQEIGLNKFDFVGANTENISHFKSQLGPELIPYFTIIKTNIIGKIMEIVYSRFIKKSLL